MSIPEVSDQSHNRFSLIDYTDLFRMSRSYNSSLTSLKRFQCCSKLVLNAFINMYYESFLFFVLALFTYPVLVLIDYLSLMVVCTCVCVYCNH